MLREAAGIKRFFVKTGWTDLRLGPDRLGEILMTEYGIDPTKKGCLFLFCGRKPTRIKCLTHEEDGYVLVQKRLDQGAYVWPKTGDESEIREITRKLFNDLLDGDGVSNYLKIHKRFGHLEQSVDEADESENAEESA